MDLALDAAAGIALEAHGVEAVFGVGKIVWSIRPAIYHYRAGFLSAERARGGGRDMSPLPNIAPRARKLRREKLGELESLNM